MEPRVRVAVCLTAAERLLLVAHRKGAHRYWLLPGGGVEVGEPLVEAARREVREETGVDAEIGRLLIVCDAIEPGGRQEGRAAQDWGQAEREIRKHEPHK